MILSSNAVGFVQGSEKWIKKFGGDSLEFGYDCEQTSDGGYIVVGATFSYGIGDENSDIWLIKIDGSGNKVWDKTYGGSGSEHGHSVQQAKDGGYIIVGYTTSYTSGLSDVYLVKTDNLGNLEWNKNFGGTGADKGFSVRQTNDGGYIIVGETESYGAGKSDVWLIKTDGSGNKVWDKTYGGKEIEKGESVQQTKDGGYIIAGETSSYGEGLSDMWLIKTDGSGNKVWDKTYGGEDGDEGCDVKQTADGGYIITGKTRSYAVSAYDAWLVKTDNVGNLLWYETYGGEGDDEACSVDITHDGGYIIAGGTWPYSTNFNSWLIKTDNLGQKLWENNYERKHDNSLLSVHQTSDGGYIATGSLRYAQDLRNYDILVIKTDSKGSVKTKSRITDSPLLIKILDFLIDRFPMFRQFFELIQN
ncbi:MAG TPA: hypothetical protein ENN45_01520 [Bacteroidetes bacterium]|nr:hypothetical protein [Bacteroidota bacterium]